MQSRVRVLTIVILEVNMGTEIICEDLECTHLEDLGPEGRHGICCLPTLSINEHGECMRQNKQGETYLMTTGVDKCKVITKKDCIWYSENGENACKRCG